MKTLSEFWRALKCAFGLHAWVLIRGRNPKKYGCVFCESEKYEITF